MSTKKKVVVYSIGGVLALGAIGALTDPATTPAPAPVVGQTPATPKPKPKPSASAYDAKIQSEIEKQIKEKLHKVAAENDGAEKNLIAHCVADTTRNFTCASTLTLRYDGGICADLTGKQRGNVAPDGDYTWKTVSVTGAKDLYSC